MTRDARSNRPRTKRPASTRPSTGRRESTRPGRPAARRSGQAPDLVKRGPMTPKRWLVLGGLMVFLAIVVGPTLNGYLQQKDEIAELGRQVSQREQSVADKQAELRRWEDPKYVEKQARERLGFVKPNQALTVLVNPDGKVVSATDQKGRVVSTTPWYGQVWQSTLAANRGDQ